MSLLCWVQKNSAETITVTCSEETSEDDFLTQIRKLTNHHQLGKTLPLVTVTLNNVEEPKWLMNLLQGFCQSKQVAAICNVKVLQPVEESAQNALVFDLDLVGFVKSYCSPVAVKSVIELSSLETIRGPPAADTLDLITLKSSLLTGWRQEQVAICSSDGRMLLDGATRVFVLKSMKVAGVPGVPVDLPVVTCLSQTPAWIINQILVLLSQSDDRRIWSPSDTLNLAAYQIDALSQCDDSVKESAIKKMRSQKAYQGFDQFIDLALIVDSRTICSSLAENLVMKNGAATFFKHLTTKFAVDYCKRISSGCKFTNFSFGSTLNAFFGKLKDSSNQAKSTVLDACNYVFRDFSTDSLRFGICVTYKTPQSDQSFLLRWNPSTLRHESISHYVCAVMNYNRFEFRTLDQDILIASKSVPALVQSLGCMQGNGEWTCEQSRCLLKVIALSSESASCQEENPNLAGIPSNRLVLGSGQAGSSTTSQAPRPKKSRTSDQRVQGQQCNKDLSTALIHELWLSLSAVEYNIQTLWNYLKSNGSDTHSFELKMEQRLMTLCTYHADLYQDSRFNDIGLRLIKDAQSIIKGSRPSKFQKIMLVFHLIRFGWFLTPVLWTRAELLFLLTAVFDPRLLFVHVVQKNAKHVYEQTQNRGMASCSKYLSKILFDRLEEFDLLSNEHECGDAVVLDSNGSYLQHYQAVRTTNVFKAMSPHKVVMVSNAPPALSCNGCYTQISGTLYAQNIAFPNSSSEFKPEPRIIECTDGRWHFKHLLAQGVDCWLMQQVAASENPHSDDEQEFFAWRGFDGFSEHVKVKIWIKEHQGSDSVHAFDYGIGGGYKRIEMPQPRDVCDAQRIHTDGEHGFDPHQFHHDGTINLTQPPIFLDRDLNESEVRASSTATSHLPDPCTSGLSFSDFSAPESSANQLSKTRLTSVFYGPLGALFSLMFGTCLGFSDCNIQIPIGACLLFSFLFPHRGALYDYLNRRFHLYILNRDFRRIPAANVEQRFRILACSKQRHHARGGVEFYDLSLLHNLSTYEIHNLHNSPFCLERFRIVYGNDWMYSGDINLAKEPNGYGTMIGSSNQEVTGYFRKGTFYKSCDEKDDVIAVTRHVNTIFMSLEFLNGGANAALVLGPDTDVIEDLTNALNCLNSYSIPILTECDLLPEILEVRSQMQSLSAQRSSMSKVKIKTIVNELVNKLTVREAAAAASEPAPAASVPAPAVIFAGGTDSVVISIADAGAAASSTSVPIVLDGDDSFLDFQSVQEGCSGSDQRVIVLSDDNVATNLSATTSEFKVLANRIDQSFCGMINPSVFCGFISLLQAWFHIKAFRNVVLKSKSEDATLTQLNLLFRSLQNRQFGTRQTDCSIQVHFLEFSVWFLHPTYLISSELCFEVSMFQSVRFIQA